MSPNELTATTDERTSARAPGRPRRATATATILRATLTLLAERGFQATTMDAIAAEAGVGKNTIYRRWPSKEELIVDAVRELTAELDTQDAADLYSLLLEWARDFERVFSDPLVGRILPALLGELQRNPEFAHAYADRVVRPRREALVALISEALASGELRAGLDAEQVADLLIGPTMLRWLFPFGLPEIPSSYAETLVETVWRGIAPSRPR
jgi:AcrR family transcriptional regulator